MRKPGLSGVRDMLRATQLARKLLLGNGLSDPENQGLYGQAVTDEPTSTEGGAETQSAEHVPKVTYGQRHGQDQHPGFSPGWSARYPAAPPTLLQCIGECK